MSQGTAIAAGGLVKFYSKEEIARYMKSLVEHYQAQSIRYGDQLGSLLRELEQGRAAARGQSKELRESKISASGGTQAKGWVKMGNLIVNVSDPSGALAEVLFQLHEDAKAKLNRVSEALKSFDELGSSTIPNAGLYYIQLRNGIPERVVVDLQPRRKDSFAFSADFQLV
jgi:hypothetical protein